MKRHDPDYFSLAAGLLFTILGVVFVAAALGGWAIDGRWLAPVMLIALGIGGVAASLTASSRQRRVAQEVSASTATQGSAPAGSTMSGSGDSWPTDPFA